MDKCNHKWVMYQPFSGDAYECCAKAGCGIRKSDFDEPQLSFGEHTTSYRPIDLTFGRGIDKLRQKYGLSTTAPQEDGINNDPDQSSFIDKGKGNHPSAPGFTYDPVIDRYISDWTGHEYTYEDLKTLGVNI